MTTKRKGLGKGLSALIEDDLEEKILEQNNNGVIYLKTSDVEPNREQPRKTFNEDSLHELAESIKLYGIIQPLIVTKKENYFEIIAGERRWRASKIAGLKEIPVVIKDFTQEEILAVSLIENIQRENLNPIEEALAYQRLLTEFMLKQDDIAERVSKSRSAIANIMRLLNLDNRVQQMIIDEMISSGHARTLLALEDKQTQYELAYKIFDEKLSVRETEKLIKSIMKPSAKKQKTIENMDMLEPIYREMEKNIQEILGTKVTINRKNEHKGNIEIEYFSMEELERISDLLSIIKAN
ncbi:MAG: chromosome partitioning protein ParB [Firmicutes bacterium HGW-Firmicutes-1]|jgi:ParB family chromosome partitioning protein|nr:MAG: chromosome partitioning protein ParB [Firmicutes bacterium HGW-Firmicutes-1]